MFFLFAVILAVFFIVLDGPTTFRNTFSQKYTMAKAIGFKNIYYIVKTATFVIIKTMYTKLIQKYMCNLKNINKNTWLLSYTIDGQYFCVFINKKKGPHPVLGIYDNDGNEVTDSILPYHGANRDFHGQSLTPKLLNYHSLSFEMNDGSTKTFESDDVFSKILLIY